ncbi:hypothetical protein F1847_07035 [Thermodesulfobacterium sp. TA1]|uniref:hypothetical protein n=1 Tax=Thermodesulfobacterium sp. TA1 TaxID=2234087 RepID=UPI0012326297|nr:hypothetical protein [Thermodesulfobacterium sp. TA1]QER42510.1 hypothetical protein F1847_07035 [Thermodesulfobacterium sp. TA1]
MNKLTLVLSFTLLLFITTFKGKADNSMYEVNKSTKNFEVNEPSEIEKSSKYEKWLKAAREAEKERKENPRLKNSPKYPVPNIDKKGQYGRGK